MINSVTNKSNNNFITSKSRVTPAFTGKAHIAKEAADVFISSASKEVESFPQKLINFLKTQILKKASKTEPWAKNLQEKILTITKEGSDAAGKDAIVFKFPGRDDLVLRVEKTALEKIDTLPKDLKLIPVSYEKSVAENEHFGLPLYFVAEKGSPLSKLDAITPQEALKQPDKIMLLKKMTGVHPSEKYYESFIKMQGLSDTAADPEMIVNSRILNYIINKYGPQASTKYLEKCKEGVSLLEEGTLCKDSGKIEIFNGKEFYKNYRDFVNNYIETLKQISEIPQNSFNNAVDSILSKKDFILDFQHTNNTFVDFEKGEFNFMDFVFDKTMYPKYHCENPVKEFRNVLMGKWFSGLCSSPRNYIVVPEDVKAVKEYSKIINEKINTAAPERFRSESPFR